MKNQIHENFMTETLTLKGETLTPTSKKLLVQCLNEQHIHGKSISAITVPEDENGNVRLFICVGYTKSKAKKETFDIAFKKIGMTYNVNKAIENLEKIAEKDTSVICQSLVTINETLYALLLTHK